MPALGADPIDANAGYRVAQRDTAGTAAAFVGTAVVNNTRAQLASDDGDDGSDEAHKLENTPTPRKVRVEGLRERRGQKAMRGRAATTTTSSCCWLATMGVSVAVAIIALSSPRRDRLTIIRYAADKQRYLSRVIVAS